MTKKAFVTGGTGFIGINLIAQLIREGWSVTALYRTGADTTYLKQFDIERVEGAIQDKATLEKVMPADLDAVFHLAGDTNYWKKNNALQTETNVTGTRNMVDTAVQKRAKCFIHTSSISAWGYVPGMIDEQTPQQGGTSWINYEKTKWAGERAAFKAVEQGIKVVVLNPGTVVGPYDKNSWGRTFFAIQNGELPLLPPGDTCLAHVHEVVKAHIAAVEKGQNGHRYILGGINTPYAVFLREVARLLGKDPPSVGSTFLFKTVGWLMEKLVDITGKVPLITPELANMTTRKGYQFSSEKAQKELDFRTVSLQVCVYDCYQWLLKEGLISGHN